MRNPAIDETAVVRLIQRTIHSVQQGNKWQEKEVRVGVGEGGRKERSIPELEFRCEPKVFVCNFLCFF